MATTEITKNVTDVAKTYDLTDVLVTKLGEQETPVNLVELIDEAYALETELKKVDEKYKPKRERLAELEKYFLEVVNTELSSEMEATLQGEDGGMEISPRNNQTTITSMEQARDLLGVDNLLKICKVTLADLKQYLSGIQLATITKTERTGPRRIKYFQKKK